MTRKALIFSDLHGRYKQLQNLKDFFKDEQKDQITVLIFAGDFLNTGEPFAFVETFTEAIETIGLPFLWVPGNNDFGRGYYKLNSKYKSLEGRVVEIDGFKFSGVGGSPASWAGQYQGEKMIDKKDIAGTVFVSHQPTPGLLVMNKEDYDSPISEKKFRQGKQRSFSDAPRVHICGHVHSRWGVGYLGQTKVINPGPLELGHYAILDLDNLKVDFRRFV